MKNNYVLCYKYKSKEGKSNVYSIYESNLKNIDMYTSYCFSLDILFKCFPDEVNKFIRNDLGDTKGEFFIKRNKTNLTMLLKEDSDIVYANGNDIYQFLLKLLNTDDYRITNIKKEFYKKANKVLFMNNTYLRHAIEDNIERENPWSIGRELAFELHSNLRIISDYLNRHYELKREFLILLKKYIEKINSVIDVKMRLLTPETLEKRIEQRYFSINAVNKKILDMLKPQKASLHKENVTPQLDNDFIYPIGEDENYDRYLEALEKKNCGKMNDDIEDIYEDDDFYGPKEANDPRYRNIN